MKEFSSGNHFPKIILKIVAPILRSIPDLVIGIPVSLAIFCFACVIPIKRFQENVKPLIIYCLLVNLVFMATDYAAFVGKDN